MNLFKSMLSTPVLLATLIMGNATFAHNLAYSSPATKPNLESRTDSTLSKARIKITAPTPPSVASCQSAVFGFPEAQYQQIFDAYTSNSTNRLLWVDGYEVKGQTYFNFIFNKCGSSVPWIARHGMTSNQLKQAVQQYKGQGFRPIQLDSYLSGGAIRYAAIFVKDSGSDTLVLPQQSLSDYQNNFESLTAQGYRAVNISVVQYKGQSYFTLLFDKKSVGAWYARTGLTSSQYQQEFNKYVAQGLKLAYLNGYTENGVTKFSAIWNSEPYSAWEARHNLTSSEFKTQLDQKTKDNYVTRFITGYQDGSIARFAGLWTK